MKSHKPETNDDFENLDRVFDSIEKLDKDLLIAGTISLTRDDVRVFVDIYYSLQKQRIGMNNKVSAMDRCADEGSSTLQRWFLMRLETLEKQAAKALYAWAKNDPVCVWAMQQKGVGPILAAGLGGHIDITKAPTVGHIWRFAGLEPTVKWIGRSGAQELCGRLKAEFGKPTYDAIAKASAELKIRAETIERFAKQYGDGKTTWESLSKSLARCPWNARLKTICWKISDSFVKCHNRPGCIYGQYYAERKAKEIEMNLRGKLAEQAKKCLAEKRIGNKEVLAILKQGMLPAGAIEARAKRWTVKLFLAHWHDVAYRAQYGKAPPLPYPIAYMGHTHVIEVPQLVAEG